MCDMHTLHMMFIMLSYVQFYLTSLTVYLVRLLRLSTISLWHGTLESQDANVWCSTIYYTVYFENLT